MVTGGERAEMKARLPVSDWVLGASKRAASVDSGSGKKRPP